MLISPQALPSILVLRTDPGLALDPVASDKAHAVSISSMQSCVYLSSWLLGSLTIVYSGGYNVPLGANPFVSDLKVLDCGDVPVTSCVAGSNDQRKDKTDRHLSCLATIMPGQFNRLKKATTVS